MNNKAIFRTLHAAHTEGHATTVHSQSYDEEIAIRLPLQKAQAREQSDWQTANRQETHLQKEVG